jgi:hypothetical protein
MHSISPLISPIRDHYFPLKFPTNLRLNITPAPLLNIQHTLEADLTGHDLKAAIDAENHSDFGMASACPESTPNLQVTVRRLYRPVYVEEARCPANLLVAGLSETGLDDHVHQVVDYLVLGV